jgi:hypothetical protein
MRPILFALAAVAVASALDLGAAQAEQYPFCLLTGPGPGDCKYTSYAQCQAAAFGTGFICQPNFALRQSSGAQDEGRRSSRANGARGHGPQS